MSLKAPALQKGDRVGIMAPSCWIEEEDLNTAKNFFEQQGYDVFIHPQAIARLHQSAGSAHDKITAFHDLLRDPEIKAIFVARGGNRAITMIDQIDFSLVQNNPKIIMGYSDMTVFLNALYAKSNLIGFHGPTFREFKNHPDYTQMISLLSGKETKIDLTPAKIIKEGSAQGRLFGGNLSVFQTLLGTPYLPDMNGAILFLEDVGDHLSRYDRMLGHLRISGVLEKINALIIGNFSNVQDNNKRPFGFSLEEIILEHTYGLDIPILMDAPFGHQDRLVTLPIGCDARLENNVITFQEASVLG